MFVVPIHNDKIRTTDDSDVRVVSSYTSLKNEPAVYVTAGSSRERYIYFSDIVEINGVKVEYESSSKIFSALGPLKRKYNIPQPKDTVVVKLLDVPFKEETEEVEVTAIRLHSKKHGVSNGLLIIGAKSAFPLNEIIDLKRKEGFEKFDADRFKKYYRDYYPYNVKATGQ